MWGWQVTYTYNADGSVASFNVDLSSAYWFKCDTPLGELSSSTVPALDGQIKEVDRVDTAHQWA